MTDVQMKFLILIVLVVIITGGFALLVWLQTIKFEKKALLAKQRQKEYEKEMRKKLWAEMQAQREAEKLALEDENSEDMTTR